MFGTNPIRKQRLESGLELNVQSIFPTIQGEGPFAGKPAVFLRLAGCNLKCHFCDTDFESRRQTKSLYDVVAEISKLSAWDKVVATTLVVITGGEPFIQNIVPLCEMLILKGFDVQIETAGTLWNPGLEDVFENDRLTIVCSPKTGKVHSKIESYCFDWKYLIQEGQVDATDGLPNQSTQVPGVSLRLFRSNRRTDRIWLQPCEAYKVEKEIKLTPLTLNVEEMSDQKVTSSIRDQVQSQRNITLARDLAMKYNYRISLQVHKFLGIP